MESRRHSPVRLFFSRAAFMVSDAARRDRKRHYVRDYSRLVRRLKAEYPLDEAMSLAVGGSYVEMGARLADIMLSLGLADRHDLLDLGCGSGRLASALSERVDIDYTGIDIIPELLGYARRKTPKSYRFILSRALNLPAVDGGFDFVSAFSVFTHLQHEESYCYLSEALRVLKPGGSLVLSFLEFADPAQWPVFAATVAAVRRGQPGIANVFIERPVIQAWADRLGFSPPVFYGSTHPGPIAALGQSVAVLKRM